MTDRYKNGKIYKLISDKTDKIYIGSTCLPLYKRLYTHKSETNKCCSRKLFELGGKVDIVLIEEFPTDSKDKLFARERFHIEQNNCINRSRPILSEVEKKEAVRKCMSKYLQTEKGKATLCKYFQSEKCKAKQLEYSRSEKGKLSKAKSRLKRKLRQTHEGEAEYAPLIFIE